MWTYNGKQIKEGKAWTDNNGIQHPANWHIWTEQEKQAVGLVWITLDTPPDSRLYTWSYNADGTITSTAKSIEDVYEVDEDGNALLDGDGNQIITFGVKTKLKEEVKAQQAGLLAQTDWAIIRRADTNIDVPTNIQKWRDEIRLAAAAMEDQITQAADIDAIAALFITYDEDGNRSGTLYEWPELVR